MLNMNKVADQLTDRPTILIFFPTCSIKCSFLKKIERRLKIELFTFYL